jgi:Bacterial regulatory helix-turn-helix protein, lysR family
MDLYQLKTFVAVVREGSITRASELLHLSQPSVSAHIKAVEDALGLSLFDRTPKGMSLTREGREDGRGGERREVQAQPVDPVSDHALEGIEHRRGRLRRRDAQTQRGLQHEQRRDDGHEADAQGRQQRRRLRPLQAERRQQQRREGDADGVMRRPPQQQFAPHRRRAADALVHEAAFRQMAEPPAEKGEVQRGNAQPLQRQGPQVHHQRGANAKHHGAYDEFSLVIHDRVRIASRDACDSLRRPNWEANRGF